MADEIADMFGGQVAKAPIKSQERAIQKIMNHYGGDASKRIQDSHIFLMFRTVLTRL
ncbi:hypothetical protein [Shewanella algae]|uniref:hypothetical protein n=1 Tax=Shewanella algae TaxID=38313 RepID=UPI001481F6E2|nr:hypothetical protein [Shewanella algae]